MKKALVTGSTGFIGRHLVVELQKRDYKVRCLARKESDMKLFHKNNVEIENADYSDYKSLKRAVEGIDVVFHLGALLNGKNREEYYKANVESTKNLVLAYESIASKKKRFVFISSIAASGPAGKNGLKSEGEADNPVSLYGESKLLAEKEVKRNSDDIEYVILRPPNIYGPGQREMAALISVVKKRILPLLGNKNSETSLLYVEDLVNAIIIASEKNNLINNTYFVTDNKVYSWRYTIKLIAKELGVYPFVLPLPGWVLEVIAWKLQILSKIFHFDSPLSLSDLRSIKKNRWTFDGTAFMKATGFTSNIKIKEGIHRTIEYIEKK